LRSLPSTVTAAGANSFRTMQSRPFTRRTPDLTDFPPEVKCAP
jgi:hypothetical protein